MAITTTRPVVLERASQEFVDATSTPPFIYELSPDEARKVLDDVQAEPIDKLPVDERWITVPADVGDVRVRIVTPPDARGTLPAILYMHGGGWVLGNAGTHDRLVRELAVGTGAAVVFVEYDRSPEAHYPVAIEQGYATAQWITREGAAHGLDPERIAVAGDRLGRRWHDRGPGAHGKRARRRALRATVDVLPGHGRRHGHRVVRAVRGGLLPRREGDGVVLGRLPARRRATLGAVCLAAPRERRAARWPTPAFLIVDEADVLRDEGEAYAARLRAAGVPITTVRYDGITHDFMMFNPLSATRATRAAVAQAISILRQALNDD
jgi:acetyl esterase